MSNITTTINIDDPVGGHQRSRGLIGLATPVVLQTSHISLVMEGDMSLLFQRFVLEVVEWRISLTGFDTLPKISIYTDAGRFQRMSPYLHNSNARPQVPLMQGSFIIIHLLQRGFHPQIETFKIIYLVLNTRPPPAQHDVTSQSGML